MNLTEVYILIVIILVILAVYLIFSKDGGGRLHKKYSVRDGAPSGGGNMRKEDGYFLVQIYDQLAEIERRAGVTARGIIEAREIGVITQHLQHILYRLKEVNSKAKSNLPESETSYRPAGNYGGQSSFPEERENIPDSDASRQLMGGQSAGASNQFDPSTSKVSPAGIPGLISQMYNIGVDDRNEREVLWKRFPKYYRLGNRNAARESMGLEASTEFSETDNGDFIAIEDKGLYFVVPQFDIAIKDTTYDEGGVSSLFICPGYIRGKTYTDVKVREPGRLGRQGDTWIVENPGELILLQY